MSIRFNSYLSPISRPFATKSQPFYNQNLRKISLTDAQNLEAGQKWNYPCDHISVFGRVDALRVATLNTQNTLYISHLRNVPGWSDSYLVKRTQEKSKKFPEFSSREEEICSLARTMLRENPCIDVLGIQECGDKMYSLLKSELEPLRIQVVLGDGKRNNHVATLVNLEKFEIVSAEVKPVFRRMIDSQPVLVLDQWRPVVDVVIQDREPHFRQPNRYRIMNLHISSAGQSEEYKLERLREVSEYAENTSLKDTPNLILGDFNACKTLIHQVFSSEAYRSLCSHHTQIENIVDLKTGMPVEPPHLVSIDDILLQIPVINRPFHQSEPVHPSQTSDEKAAWTLKHIFDPLSS